MEVSIEAVRRIRRNAPWICVLWVMFACVGPRSSVEQGLDEVAGPPDVILVTFCTMRADRFGVYGGRDLTPTIDSLAEQGAVFRNHYTQASFSGASFASIITGRYPSGHGVYDHPRRLDDELVTVAEVFHQAGYATGGFLTHTYLRPKWNYLQGLEVYNGYDRSRLGLKALMSRSVGSPGDQVREALQWADSFGDRPYFLWLQLQLTHHFPQVKPPFVEEKDFEAARGFRRQTEGATNAQRMFAFDELGVTEEQLRGYVAAYDGAVARSDRLLSRILAGLEERGRLNDAIIVITADHGETLGEKGLFATHDSNLLEPTSRIPLVIRVPGLESRRVEAVSRNIDLLPTLVELAGLEPPADLPGTSLVPLLRGEETDLPAFSETRPKVAERGNFDRYRLLVAGVDAEGSRAERADHER